MGDGGDDVSEIRAVLAREELRVEGVEGACVGVAFGVAAGDV